MIVRHRKSARHCGKLIGRGERDSEKMARRERWVGADGNCDGEKAEQRAFLSRSGACALTRRDGFSTLRGCRHGIHRWH